MEVLDCVTYWRDLAPGTHFRFAEKIFGDATRSIIRWAVTIETSDGRQGIMWLKNHVAVIEPTGWDDIPVHIQR